MKKNKLFLLFVLLFFANQLWAGPETEPNNTRADANTLALNGSNTGAINVAGDEDWFKVTTNADGRLDVTLTVSNSLYLWCYIYDNDGTTLLKSDNTNGTKLISVDGLATGTYYMKLVAYYSGQLPAYTISNNLVKPAEANDSEPNNTKAQAKVLNLNSSATGHINYYYNNLRDTFDWYKVTTNADGRIRLRLTSGNSQYVWAYLYDNDGITLLTSDNTNGTKDINKDGLAAGTYYVVIKSYYANGYIPYTIEDSLFKPDQENDNEPNNTKAQAKVLNLNSSATGHINYYYNNLRDTFDWYKVTTNADGMIRLRLTSENSQYVWAYLYDNDGTTLLNSNNTNGTIDISKDGLAEGTYYVKIRAYYDNGYVPYTIEDSLFTYTYTVDQEPNDYASQAKTLPANGEETGHVNFYYNNNQNGIDWWKINYTGSGNLKIVVKNEPWKIDGSQHYYWVDVYKDTSAAALYHNNTIGNTTINLSSLTQGYYYIKVYPYYSTQHISYLITDTFTQVNKAKIVFFDTTITNSCDNASITYKLSDSHDPYTVRLFKNNNQIDSAIVTGNSVTFNNLNAGNYYTTAYGDGATGNAFGQSANTQILPPYPTGTSESDITTSSAKLHWSDLSCVSSYKVQYRKEGSASWISQNTTNPTLALSGLLSDTKYYWQVQSIDNTDGLDLVSAYSALDSFKTLAILPVTFINFDGVLQNGNAILNWSTANEINNKGFEVQKSTNGQTFTDIGFVAGNGNSSTVHNYTYTDVKVVSGANYYRLKQIDNNGAFTYSSVIKLNYAVFGWDILGNPSSNSWIQLQLDKSSNVSVQIVSMNGNIIQTINKGNLMAGTYSIPLNLAGKSAGMYVVRLIVDGQPDSKKIVK